MPLLWVNHVPLEAILSGVWEVAANRGDISTDDMAECRLYFCENRTRKPRPIHAFRDRRAVRLTPSGRETLAAANSRSKWVFCDGCPVLSLHLSFGLAPHIGQRTDSICPKLRLSGFTSLIIRHRGLARWSILLCRISNFSKTELAFERIPCGSVALRVIRT